MILQVPLKVQSNITMLNQINVNLDAETYTELSQQSIKMMDHSLFIEDLTDEDSPRVNYL